MQRSITDHWPEITAAVAHRVFNRPQSYAWSLHFIKQDKVSSPGRGICFTGTRGTALPLNGSWPCCILTVSGFPFPAHFSAKGGAGVLCGHDNGPLCMHNLTVWMLDYNINNCSTRSLGFGRNTSAWQRQGLRVREANTGNYEGSCLRSCVNHVVPRRFFFLIRSRLRRKVGRGR